MGLVIGGSDDLNNQATSVQVTILGSITRSSRDQYCRTTIVEQLVSEKWDLTHRGSRGHFRVTVPSVEGYTEHLLPSSSIDLMPRRGKECISFRLSYRELRIRFMYIVDSQKAYTLGWTFTNQLFIDCFDRDFKRTTRIQRNEIKRNSH